MGVSETDIGRIEKAIRNLKEAVGHADTWTECPIYWDDFHPWFQQILDPIIRRLNDETLVFLGTPGTGKTLTQMILGFAISRVSSMSRFFNHTGNGKPLA